MGNREERWKEMKQEYHNHSMSEGQVEKMKERMEQAKKEKRKENRHHTGGKIAAAAAAAAVIITILPNTSADVAYAMSRIPILSKWVEVVTFRDYQYEDDRNTADITIPEIVPQISTENEEGTASADGKEGTVDTQTKENIQKTAEEINAEIQNITERLIEEFEENLKYKEGYQDMMVKSEIIATTENYFTLKLICYQGAGSGAEWDYFYTIDLATGERLTLADLFTEGSDYVTAISENIKEQMKEQMAADENVAYWLDSDIPEWNFKEITDETGFYLNEKGEVVISFNEGDVAPMYMGCVEFTIPNEILADIRK